MALERLPGRSLSTFPINAFRLSPSSSAARWRASQNMGSSDTEVRWPLIVTDLLTGVSISMGLD